MLRESNAKLLAWVDKTMSVMRARQLEACEQRLSTLPDVGLFGRCDDRNAEQLWHLSYDAQEHPFARKLHTVRELQAQLLIRLPAEAALLSFQEEQLVERLLSLGGSADLMDWDELDAAESLVRRLWCTLSQESERSVLHMPQELMTPLMLVSSSKAHEMLRDALYQFEETVNARLYLGGLMPECEALALLEKDVLKDSYAADETLARRYLRIAFDYAFDEKGETLLLHPGLAEPERMLRTLRAPAPFPREVAPELLRQAASGMLDEERPSFERLCGLLSGAVRPEIGVEEAVEDLRMLAKQGVSLEEMNEVLSSLLMVRPSDAMRQGVRLLHDATPRWGTLRTGVMN